MPVAELALIQPWLGVDAKALSSYTPYTLFVRSAVRVDRDQDCEGWDSGILLSL
ncbi:hypothetical protein QUB68_07230 [Microcoleus sp. A006_D1]|uniref:hypothetical protein n=1 Tax=Microcoleus sp. A006_D1 TaxID=3055267 RepID=UPI002FD6B95B